MSQRGGDEHRSDGDILATAVLDECRAVFRREHLLLGIVVEVDGGRLGVDVVPVLHCVVPLLFVGSGAGIDVALPELAVAQVLVGGEAHLVALDGAVDEAVLEAAEGSHVDIVADDGTLDHAVD